MKKSELRKIIKEEISKVLKEDSGQGWMSLFEVERVLSVVRNSKIFKEMDIKEASKYLQDYIDYLGEHVGAKFPKELGFKVTFKGSESDEKILRGFEKYISIF